MTYTFAELEVPAEVYDLIAAKLIEAGYGHVFDVGVRPEVGKDCGPIDMMGIALTRAPQQLWAIPATGGYMYSDALAEVLKEPVEPLTEVSAE